MNYRFILRRSRGAFVHGIIILSTAPMSFCFVAAAQNQRPNPMPSSELGRDNLRLVAASAGEIKAILFKDAGLMVALKFWVAKDATEHGQIVSESDLTNDAIFERLEEDAQFRSVATALVQRYGYLLPKLNPDSEVAKEHELLVQERTKWQAQNQEEELAEARKRRDRKLQTANSCNPSTDASCEKPGTAPSDDTPPTGPARNQALPPDDRYNPLNPPARDSFGYPQTMEADNEGFSDIPFPLADAPRSKQSSESFGIDGTPRELTVGEATGNRRNQSGEWLFEADAENRNSMGGAISKHAAAKRRPEWNCAGSKSSDGAAGDSDCGGATRGSGSNGKSL